MSTFISNVINSKNFKRNISLTFFMLSLLVWFGFSLYGHYYISTDDAYLNANIVQIASRISGKVNHVYIKNNAHVEKGQLLFDIDSEPYELAIDSAKAQQMQGEVKYDQANITAKRTLPLVTKKVLAPQTGDNTLSLLKSAEAELNYSKAQLKQAMLNLQYTKVFASVSGWVTNVTLQPGDIITAHQPLFALISDEEFWADANFKETEIANIKPGQTASILIDMYPKHKFHGIVESISGGAGSAFSLLPPQNATGNWVKVTQRIPIKIKVIDPNNDVYPIRIGTSATVTIALK